MMKIQRKYPLLFFVLVAVVLLISACSQTTTGNSNQSSLSPLQVLQNSANAMKQVKSSHVDVQSADSVQASATTATPATGATATPMATNLSVTIKGSGDQAGVDQQKLDLTVTAFNQSIALSEISQSDKVYVKANQGQWYVLNKSDFQNAVSANPFSGITLDQNALLGLIQDVKLTDHGTVNLNGQSLRYITADLDKNALRQLVTQDPQLESMFGQQNINAILNNTKTFLATVDVWIDETHFYLHRTHLKINVAGNPSSATNGAVSSAATNIDATFDLSKFNDPVTITPPTNATPATNPSAIFGGNQGSQQ